LGRGETVEDQRMFRGVEGQEGERCGVLNPGLKLMTKVIECLLHIRQG